jgi:DNA-binding beta-propeller fold protein YncE
MGTVPRRRFPVLAVAIALAVAGVVLIVLGVVRHGDPPLPPAPTGAAPRPAAPAAHRSSRVRLRLAATWRLPAPVQLPALAAAPGGRVLAAGGLDAADVSVPDLVRLRPGPPRRAGRLPQAVHDAAATTVGGATYVFGGGTASGSSAAVVRAGAAGSGARTVAQLPSPSSDIEAATVRGTAYVVGGYTGAVPLRSILAFRPGRPVRLAGRLPRPLRYAAVAATEDGLIIAGGTSGTTPQRAILRFDPASGRVRRIGTLPRPLTHAGGAALGGTFYVLGGRGANLSSQTSRVWAVDARSGRVRAAGRLPAALSDVGATADAGAVLVAGGRDARGRVHDQLWALRPARTRAARAAFRVPAPVDPRNVYAAAARDRLARIVRGERPRVYVPNSQSDTVDVIDQRSGRIVDHFATGGLPQHVTPSWDLRTLWVTNDTGNSLTPIDPRTGRHGRPVPVTDPYNLYFTADGRRAIVVAEAHRRLDFRTPHTMRLTHSLALPGCRGADHMDFTRDGRLALVSCEFAGRMVVVDLRRERAIKSIDLRPGAMPQDVKLSPDGRTFYAADMAGGGVWLIDARRMRKIRFERTGRGAHGLYPSRDARVLYVSNRDDGTISLISFRTRRPFRRWRLPGGGSPDMGGVSADGRVLWLSGRYDSEVYAISTRTGRLLRRVRVGSGPHGMCVWPQPGRYSIGHTGILR